MLPGICRVVPRPVPTISGESRTQISSNLVLLEKYRLNFFSYILLMPSTVIISSLATCIKQTHVRVTACPKINYSRSGNYFTNEFTKISLNLDLTQEYSI